MADGIDHNARQWIDRRDELFARGWRGRRDAAVSVFRERGFMMAAWPVLFLVNGSGPSARLAVASGGEGSGVATNWAPCAYYSVMGWLYFRSQAVTLASFIFRDRLLNSCGDSASDNGFLLRFCTCSGWMFRRFGLTCFLCFSGAWIGWGGCWSDTEENHFGIQPNRLSHTDGGIYVPKRRYV
jgi:hypothetical protein